MGLEAILNSRPPVYYYDEFEAEMVTPSHLIYGRRLLSLSEMRKDEKESEMGVLRKFRYLARQVENSFLEPMAKEYPTYL